MNERTIKFNGLQLGFKPTENLIKIIDKEIKSIKVKTNDMFDSDKVKKNSLLIKVRSTGRLIKSSINLSKKLPEVNLKEIETGISPGQACVFYSKNNFGEKMLGGGWIAETEGNFYPHN